MANYKQKELSVTPEQAEIIKANTPGKSCKQLAEQLGLTANIIQANRVLLGLCKQRSEAKIIDFGTNGFFDERKWGKLFNY